MRILAAFHVAVSALLVLLAAGCSSAPRAQAYGYTASTPPPERYLPAPAPEPRPPAPPRDLFTRDVVFLGEEALDDGDWPAPTTGSWDDGSPVDRGDGVLRVQPQRRWYGHRGGGNRRGGGYRHGGGRGSQGCAPVSCAPQPVCAPQACTPAYQQPVSFRARWQR
jgi:hypothetical protein